jgi:glycosyltransferase involved in cell wall biosynthesis
MEVAKALVNAGHESIVISAGGRMVEQLETAGSRHITWDLGRKSILTLRHIRPLRRWIKQEQPDIIHLRSRLPAWIAWLACNKLPEQLRPRLVSTVHGLYSVSKYSAVMCKPERVIAVSETVQGYIRDKYSDTDMDKVLLIPRGVDPDEFPRGYQASSAWLEDWYRQYPRLKDKKVLTLPGRLSRSKGHQDFLYLLQSLRLRGHECHGLIVGDAGAGHHSYVNELRQMVKELGLAECVTFTGPRSDMREIYAVSDLVLSLSSKPESFGRTVVESLSIGTPVVGYGHGGVNEILQNLFSQGIVPVEDSAELSNRVESLLCQERITIKDNTYLLQNMLDATINCYDDLLRTPLLQAQHATI